MSRFDALLVLPTIHHILQVEQLLRQAGIPTDMLPKPTSISHDCGMVLAVQNSNLASVVRTLHENRIGQFQLFLKQGKTWTLLPAENVPP